MASPAGVGIDVALTQNIFLRGELEYIYFFPVDGITSPCQLPHRRRR